MVYALCSTLDGTNHVMKISFLTIVFKANKFNKNVKRLFIGKFNICVEIHAEVFDRNSGVIANRVDPAVFSNFGPATMWSYAVVPHSPKKLFHLITPAARSALPQYR